MTSHRSRLSRLVKATSHFISSSFHLLPECYAIVGLEGEVTCRHDNVICDGVLRVKITELAELDRSKSTRLFRSPKIQKPFSERHRDVGVILPHRPGTCSRRIREHVLDFKG